MIKHEVLLTLLFYNKIEIDLKISKQILTFSAKLYFYLYRIQLKRV